MSRERLHKKRNDTEVGGLPRLLGVGNLSFAHAEGKIPDKPE
jgi:hypothetical protein